MLFFITYSFIDNYTDTKMRGPMLIICPEVVEITFAI